MGNRGLFITGTDTSVGKTQVALGLAALIHHRLLPQSTAQSTETGDSSRQVQLWKPVQTGVSLGDRQADSYVLSMGSGLPQGESEIASVTLPEPLAPWMSARRAGTALDYAKLAAEGYRRLEQNQIMIVEGAGGLAVPLTDNNLIVNLAQLLDLPLIIVCRPDLGTVNHTLLTIAYARKLAVQIAGVVINGCRDQSDASLAENAFMIEHFGGVPVIGKLPWFPCDVVQEDAWGPWREQWMDIIEQHMNINELLQYIEIGGINDDRTRDRLE